MHKVSFYLLYDDSQAPHKADSGASGYDIKAYHSEWIKPGETKLIKTGFAIHLPENFEAQIRPRSGLALKNGVTVLNTPGTVDSSYRLEVGVILINHSNADFVVNKGDRIAQLVIMELPKISVECVYGQPEAHHERRGGFGSTGVK